jgi:hypothetical protein
VPAVHLLCALRIFAYAGGLNRNCAMASGGLDIADIALRLIGAFYAFAGYVATRAGLTSYFIDRAIAAIALKKPPAAETAQTAWLLCAAVLVLIGGVLLMLLLDLAAWAFAASSLAQVVYLFFAAPRYFDVDDPPDPRGRRQSTNAFVLYTAATAFVLWAGLTGRLVPWRDVPWPLLALAGAAVAAHAAHTIWLLAKAPASGQSALLGSANDNGAPDPLLTRRVKVMADYDCHPLWTLDEGRYGDFAPEELGLSPELTGDLNAWAEAYTASLNREDPASSLWTEDQHRAHEKAGRPLAVRLARDRPDLTVHVLDGATGVVEVHADEPI